MGTICPSFQVRTGLCSIRQGLMRLFNAIRRLGCGSASELMSLTPATPTSAPSNEFRAINLHHLILHGSLNPVSACCQPSPPSLSPWHLNTSELQGPCATRVTALNVWVLEDYPVRAVVIFPDLKSLFTKQVYNPTTKRALI